MPRLPYAFAIASLSLAATLAPAQRYQWDSVPIGGGGFVSGIITSKSTPNLRYARTDVGGAYRWDQPNGKWIPLNDWTSEEDKGYLSVESLAIDESNPQNVYMFVGLWYFSDGRSAILRSSDYGNTFDVVEVTSQFRSDGNGAGRATGERLQVDPNNSNILYCATRRYGLFRSEDAGLTWSRLNSLAVTDTGNDNGINIVVIDPDSEANGRSQTLFAGVSEYGKSVYRSDDAGATFNLVEGAPADLLPQRAVLASDGNLFIAYANGFGPTGVTGYPLDEGAIWKYSTGSGEWTNITPEGRTPPFAGISVDPSNPQRLIASTINTWREQGLGQYGDRFFLSTDGGASWTDIVERGFDFDPNGVTWLAGKDQSIHWTGSIEFDPFDTRRAFVVSGNGLYRANDLDAETVVWTSNVEGLEETVPLGFVSIENGPALSVIGDYDGFRHTELADYAPIHRPRMGTTTGLAVAGQNPSIAARAGDQLYLSTDMGLTWSASPSRMGENGQVALSADGETLLHSPENSSSTYRSTDSGATWTAVSGFSVQNARPIADPVNGNKFYAYSGNRIHVSVDAGASFNPAATVPSNGSNRLAIVPGHEGHLWYANYSQGLYRSIDSGASFAKLPLITSAHAVGTGRTAPDADYPTLFIWGTIDGVEGILRSTDQGATWIRINDDAHQYGGPGNGQFVVGDENVFGRVYMSTVGRGIVFGEPLLDSIAYADWAASAFTREEQADATTSGEGADPDQDALSNLLEWILQTDPLRSTNLVAHTLAIRTDAPQIAIQQLANLSSATLVIEVSTDLRTWSDIDDVFVERPSQLSVDKLTRYRTYLPEENADFPSALFLRLSAHR